jgi:hypothetical protein
VVQNNSAESLASKLVHDKSLPACLPLQIVAQVLNVIFSLQFYSWLDYSAPCTMQTLNLQVNQQYVTNGFCIYFVQLRIAVFLNTGQVYFGNITEMNSKYLVINNIYYLQTANNNGGTNSSSPNVTLVKLGCELHRPYDKMVVNRDQVTFWENLSNT